MDAVVFDIWADYAMFKKPYTLASPVSFPVPPPTAIFGIVGAIVGFSKGEYLEKLSADSTEKVKVGIILLKPVRYFRSTLNFLSTKDGKFYYHTKIQIPHEFIKDPEYRIIFAHEDKEILDELAARLQDNNPVFTPYLGTSSCIADTRFVLKDTLREYQSKEEDLLNLHSVVPLSSHPSIKAHFESGVKLTRLRVPSRMQPDRTVVRYEDILVDESAVHGITVSGIQSFYKVQDCRVLLF